MTRIPAPLPTLLTAALSLALLALLALPPAQAQITSGVHPVAGRGPALGTNVAPRPGLYSVVLVDVQGRRIRLRDVDGKTIDADVAEGAYDLTKLKIGDKVRVDFAAQDTPSKKPIAATIWPEP